jgi:predicted ribosome quality control (RQC) complex YloA/Tae2 family protein
MLSLRELRRAARIVRDNFSGAVIRRVIQPDEHKLILVFEGSSGKWHLLLARKPEFGRICLTDKVKQAESPGSFYEYLRAHLPGTSLAGIDIPEENRQVGFHLKRATDEFLLIFSILGARSNLYLLNGEGTLIHSLRPLDDTRRELEIGGVWKEPSGNAPEGIDRWEDLSDGEYLEAIEQAYSLLERKGEAELLARRVEQVIKKERAFLDRKAVNLQEDLGEARQAESYRRIGELLKNVLHRIRHGDDVVKATDYETGEIVEIPLDPKLSPASNLESYFARYQKESRGVKVIEQQLGELEAVRMGLDRIGQQLDQEMRSELPDLQALESLVSQPAVHRLIQRYEPRRKPGLFPTKASAKKDIPARLLPKRYRTQEGLEIWVGKSDEGNDYLSTRLARGNDLFFHLEGYPGSHVVLRTEGRLDPPPKSLLDACELAVHFSKLKNAGNADVHMAHIKDVKKPKGAKPGLVYVRSGKAIHLRRDSKRLQSILASRLDP